MFKLNCDSFQRSWNSQADLASLMPNWRLGRIETHLKFLLVPYVKNFDSRRQIKNVPGTHEHKFFSGVIETPYPTILRYRRRESVSRGSKVKSNLETALPPCPIRDRLLTLHSGFYAHQEPFYRVKLFHIFEYS
ncbi:hypothetical protein AVEN_103011-1 [Araneus ventricosus]|uniref:Uncharacterized protein n=1 Tax=Araneus ventricosus TaxID=182803 RepID=A0A4Y2B998_ARAVE|nr:hypothetical protein AVEN_103011-1 [Araneus ventricosus]